MAVDIQQFFNQTLPNKMSQQPDKAKQLGGKFQFSIRGEEGGEWLVDATDSGPAVRGGNPGSADVTCDMSSEDFQKFYENPQANGQQMFFSGKLKITGNTMLGMKIVPLIEFGKR